MSSIAVKLPAFWPKDAELWFVQTESQFVLKNVTQSLMKYHYVVAALDQETASRCRDILRSPPSASPYERLKECLLGAFEKTEYERASQLLNLPALGDLSLIHI